MSRRAIQLAPSVTRLSGCAPWLASLSGYALLLASLSGCALVLASLSGCALVVSKSEYADYRAVRMAEAQGPKLLAMQRYVSRHPDGNWVEEVQRARAERETEVFESGKSTREGLELYLAAFPEGTFAEQARARLSAVAVIEARREQERLRAERLAEERTARDEELRRTWVSRFAGYWLRTLMQLDGWGAPIADVARGNPEFSQAFGRAPRPRCTREECVKYYESQFAVPVPGGTRMERRMRLLLRLRMVDGRVERAELLLPRRGFSRWSELERRTPVVEGDPEARRAAVAWAMDSLVDVLRELPGEATAVEGYALPTIPAPAIGPSGELVDTTAADPSAPANRIQGRAPVEPAPEPSVEEMVAPEEPEQADMVMAPLTVDEEGRRVRDIEPVMEMEPLEVPPGGQAAGEGGEVMEMQPMEVPREGGDAGGQEAGAQPPGASAALQIESLRVPPALRAFRMGNLRVAIFAAGTGAAAPAYDGVLIERAK